MVQNDMIIQTMEKIKNLINTALSDLKLPITDFVVEHPNEISHGDYSTNVALILGKELNKNSKEIGEKLSLAIIETKNDFLEKVEVAGAGFINFFLSKEFLKDSLDQILQDDEKFGRDDKLAGKKIMVEYTDPNPFKEFHIGHLMSNTVGEAIAGLIEWSGAEVKRVNYQGDVGIHVANAIAFKLKENVSWNNAQDVGKSYTEGAKLFEKDEGFKKFTEEINKKIYSGGYKEIQGAYDLGKKLTLADFDKIYKILGTKFDFYFFESDVASEGKRLVEKNTEGVFEKSEGATIFRAEKLTPSLHTRVFINSHGIPTYEAKELALAKIKYDRYSYDISIVITANEVNDYFNVVLKAMEYIYPELKKKTKHVSHGVMRLPTGKMSSRGGSIVTAEWLIDEVAKKVKDKISQSNKKIENVDGLAKSIAVGAIKYSILKQSPGKDIVFDLEKSLSFEGDSGPYLQYTHARASSVIEQYNLNFNLIEEFKKERKNNILEDQSNVTRLLYRFPEVVERANTEHSPNLLVSYLLEIASAFNNFYAHNQIINPKDGGVSTERIAITKSVQIVLRNGLKILGIVAPYKM